MKNRIWMGRIKWILFGVMYYILFVSPAWIFENDVLSVVFYVLCILFGVVYITAELKKSANRGKEN